MNRSRLLPAALLCLPIVLPSCGGGAVEGPTAPMANTISALRDNDLAALMNSMAPEAEIEKAREEWKNKKPMSDVEKAQFDGQLAMFISSDAKSTLSTMLEGQVAPLREGFDEQLEGAVGFAGMFLGGMAGDQRDEVMETLNVMAEHLKGADVLGKENLEKVVGIAVDTVKATGIESAADLEALSFDDAIDKGGLVLGGVKDVLGVYGIDIDETLDSSTFEVVSEDAEAGTATVEWTMTFLGKEQTGTANVVKHEGMWLPAEVVAALPAAGSDE